MVKVGRGAMVLAGRDTQDFHWNAAKTRDVLKRLRTAFGDITSVEAAAQRLVETLYESMRDAAVLCRLFAGEHYGVLPQTHRDFAKHLVDQTDDPSRLTKETLALSLLGTAGRYPAWCNRRKSQGHVCIPLVSEAFVRSVPMLSALLSQTGLTAHCLNTGASAQVEQLLGGEAPGLFFVEDARTAVDAEKRYIIPSRDFVEREGVISVLGAGGVWPGHRAAAMLIFLNRKISIEVARQIATIFGLFRAATTNLAMQGKLFDK